MSVRERYRFPVAVMASAVAVAAVAGALMFLAGSPIGSLPIPSPTTLPTPIGTAVPSRTDSMSTPEGVTRAFFDAFAVARRTDDPSPIEAFVTSTNADAYISVSAFLAAQKDAKKGSVLTVQRLDNLSVDLNGVLANVAFDYVEGGYDIDLTSGRPRETFSELAPYRVVVTVRQVDTRWLVDSYVSHR